MLKSNRPKTENTQFSPALLHLCPLAELNLNLVELIHSDLYTLLLET